MVVRIRPDCFSTFFLGGGEVGVPKRDKIREPTLMVLVMKPNNQPTSGRIGGLKFGNYAGIKIPKNHAGGFFVSGNMCFLSAFGWAVLHRVAKVQCHEIIDLILFNLSRYASTI